MRALVMRPGSLRVEQRPKPQPGPGQVLCRSIVCGICGSDLHLYRHAQYYYDLGLQANVPQALLDQGVVLGHEFVGEIVEYGPQTKASLPIGARVCSIPFIEGELETIPIGSTPYIDGAYAEYFLLSEPLLLAVPDSLSNEAAALTEPLAIGMHAVNRANLHHAPTAVVIGCGPIGLAVIAALKLQGLDNIVAADYSAKRRSLAAELGASTVVDPAETDAFTAIPASQANTAAAIFECTGVNGVLSQCIESAAVGSEIIVAGISHGEDTITPATASAKQLSLYFVMFYGAQEFADAMQALADERINWQPWVTGKVDLDGVEQAFEDLKDPEQHAKILIYPQGIDAA